MEILQSHPYPTTGGWGIEALGSAMDSYKEREKWTAAGMFAFVCNDWVDPLSVWLGDLHILEVMAGAGWLAKALRDRHHDVIATDDYTWADKKEWKMQTDVIKMDAAAAVKHYGALVNVLIISWPYMDDHAYEAIKTLGEVNPHALIIFIGEWEGGCTASEAFFESFEEVEDANFEPVKRAYKTWFGLHDSIYLGKYKPATP
jgi:hypothetical protein